MRICLISYEYPPDTGWGGIGAYTFQHARALKKLGHDVEVVSITCQESTEDSAPLLNPDDPLYVPVHRAAWGSLLKELSTLWISMPHSYYSLRWSLALARKFLQAHRKKPFDVIEAPEHMAEALFLALTKACPLVIRLHTPHGKLVKERYHNLTPSFDHRLTSILERTAMLEADVLSSPSRDLATYVSRDCGIDLSAIQLLPNPVDVGKFTPYGSSATNSEGSATVFFAGRLEERKGIHILIDSIPTVLARCPKVKFVIVGADTNTGTGSTSVLSSLKQRLSTFDCTGAVQFVGQVSLDEMPQHYRSAHICVVPSLYENAPYTVLEAQASGKPVITTAAGGSKEYVVDGETGLIVPPSDSQALAQAIISLVMEPDRQVSMGKAAREHVLANFASEVVASQALSTYELAIERHSATVKSSLYRKTPEESLRDFVSLMHSYHKNLYDLIFLHSLVFRLKHSAQMLRKRPSLFLTKAAVKVLRPLGRLPCHGLKNWISSMEKQVQACEDERERLELSQLFESCRILVYEERQDIAQVKCT